MTCANRLHVSNAIPASTSMLSEAVAWRLRPAPEVISDFVTSDLNTVLFENAPESLRKGRYRMFGRFPAPGGLSAGDWITLRLAWTHVLVTDGAWSFVGSAWEQEPSTSTIFAEVEEFVNVQIEEFESALSAPYQSFDHYVDPPDEYGRIYVFGPRQRGECSAEIQQRVAVVHAHGFAGYGGDGIWLTESAGGDGKPSVGDEPLRSYSGERKFEWLPLELLGDGSGGDPYRWTGGRWQYTDDWSDDAANPDYAKPFSSPIYPAAFDPLPLRKSGIVLKTNTAIHQVLPQQDGDKPITDDFVLTLSREDTVDPVARATAMIEAVDDVGVVDLFVLDLKDELGEVLTAQEPTPLPDSLIGACRFVGDASAALARIRYKVTYSIPVVFTEARDFTFTWERVSVDWETGDESVEPVEHTQHFGIGETIKSDTAWREEDVPLDDGFVYLRNFKGPSDDAFYGPQPVAELVALKIIDPVPNIGRFGESNPATTQAPDFAGIFDFIDGVDMGPPDEFSSDNLCEGCCDASSVIDNAKLWTVTSDVSACGARRGSGIADVPHGATTQLLDGGNFQGHYGIPQNVFNFTDSTYTYSGWHPNEPLACRGAGVQWAYSSCIIGAAGAPGAEIDSAGFEPDSSPCALHGSRGDPADGLIPAPWTGDGVDFAVEVKFDPEIGCQQPTCLISGGPGKQPAETETNADSKIGITEFPYSGASPCEDCTDEDGNAMPCAAVPPGAPDVLMDLPEPGAGYQGTDGVPTIVGTWDAGSPLDFTAQVRGCLDFMSLDDLEGLYPDTEVDGHLYESGVHVWIRGGADESAATSDTELKTDDAAASILYDDPLTALALSVTAMIDQIPKIDGAEDDSTSIAEYVAAAVAAAAVSGTAYDGRASDASQWIAYEMSAVMSSLERDVTGGLLNLQGVLESNPPWQISGIDKIDGAAPKNPSRKNNGSTSKGLGNNSSLKLNSLKGSSGLQINSLVWPTEGKAGTLDPYWGSKLGPLGTNSSLKIGSLEGSKSPKGSSGLVLSTLKGSDGLQIGKLKGASGLQIGSLKGSSGLEISTLKIGRLQGATGLKGSSGLKISSLKDADSLQ